MPSALTETSGCAALKDHVGWTRFCTPFAYVAVQTNAPCESYWITEGPPISMKVSVCAGLTLPIVAAE